MNRPWRPDEREARLREARRLREDGRPREALAALARLEADHPGFSRLHQERGQCHVALGEASAAIVALKEAVRLNPTLPASWDALAQLHRLRGELCEAEVAARRLDALRGLPVEVVAGHSLYADGDLDLAAPALRGYLEREPRNAGALRLLARIEAERDVFDEAETLLRRALGIAPDFADARLDLTLMLLQRERHAAARVEAERLLLDAPGDPAALKAVAAACVGLGDCEAAIVAYDRLLAGLPGAGGETAEILAWRAHALKTAGRAADAVTDYKAAVEAQPDYGVAWFGLANLKTYRFAEDEVARLRAAGQRPGLHDLDRIYLAFALGKALEDRADHAGSWTAYARGNALRRRSSRYAAQAVEAAAARIAASLTREAFEARQGWGASDPAPIFIVGLPRSGSTLVEQILASHPQVEGTQELVEIGRYAAELCGQDPACALPLRPEALLSLSRADALALGERYLADTRAYRRTGRRRFTDKMPANAWHVGLIALALPNARILDVRREPMACGFSNLKQLFGSANQEFAYDATDFGRYYRTYLALMRHWDAALPGRVLRVSYEDLVDDLEGGVRRLLDHCGLPFDPACLRFNETRRSVRTPSAEQVRRPIGRESLDQWRNYAPWLEPLRKALGDALTAYRD